MKNILSQAADMKIYLWGEHDGRKNAFIKTSTG